MILIKPPLFFKSYLFVECQALSTFIIIDGLKSNKLIILNDSAFLFRGTYKYIFMTTPTRIYLNGHQFI